MAVVSMALVLTVSVSCNKEETATTKDSFETSIGEYAFINPEWELVDGNYLSEDGKLGFLYVNKNNGKEFCFEVKGGLKMQGGDYNGHYTSKTVTRSVCQLNTDETKDCKITNFVDGSVCIEVAEGINP
jgi:hypothetical protein